MRVNLCGKKSPCLCVSVVSAILSDFTTETQRHRDYKEEIDWSDMPLTIQFNEEPAF